MKIVQICFYYSPVLGGVEKVVQAWSEGLVRNGHSVTVLCYPGFPGKGIDQSLPSVEVINGVVVKRLKTRGVIACLIKNRFDVVHVHSFPSVHFVVGIIIAKLRGEKVFASGHYAIEDLKGFRLKNGAKSFYLHKMLLRLVNGYHAIVPSEKQGIEKIFGISDKKIFLLPNGYSKAEFDGTAYAKSSSSFNVIFIGRLTQTKGIDILLDAYKRFAFISQKVSSLTICGPVVEVDYYKRLKDEAKENESISFVEWSREELCRRLPSFDVLVLPSRGEVFGIVLIEAMAAGVIPIGSDSGGIPEVINDGVTGFLFTNGSVEALAGVLNAISLKDKDWKQDFIEDMKKNAKCYEWDCIVSSLERAYGGHLVAGNEWYAQ